MAPPKSRPVANDSPNLSTQKSHAANVQLSSNANGKQRATNGNGHTATSNLRDVTAISSLDDTTDQQRNSEEQGGEVRFPSGPACFVFQLTNHAFPQINFPALPTTLLASYRHAYRLSTPAAFTSPYNELILTRPSGIGRLSPTMAKVRGKRRVRKEHLALAVRKNFKERSVVEAEAAACFLYSVRHQGEWFGSEV